MTGGAGLLDMNGMPGGQGNFECEDRKKEEEEAECNFSQDDLDRWGSCTLVACRSDWQHDHLPSAGAPGGWQHSSGWGICSLLSAHADAFKG